VDVAAEAGLTRVTHAGRPGKDHLLDSAGTGAAWLDYDGDRHLDAYIVNGWLLSDEHEVVARGRNALYRNRGDGTFEDVTEAAGVTGEGHWGSGVAVADYDDDGHPDILVTNFGPNLLYRNRGDGTFENVAPDAGIEAPGWNTGASFFDADGDGDLDLYIAAYIDHSLDQVLAARRDLSWKGLEMVAVGPFGLPGAPDHFFLADGDGGFVEATEAAGLTDKGLAFGFSTRAADLDLDGDMDLYVANDSDPNYFYRNNGDGTFQDVGLWSGAALDAGGAAQAGMGLAIDDADGDTLPDILVTNFAEDSTTLYKGDGHGFFDDVSMAAGIREPTYMKLSWGAVLADLDHDGDRDMVIANGHLYPQVDKHPDHGMTYTQANLLLENTGKGAFVDASATAGPGFAITQGSHGLAAGDYDNDGDLDLLITNLDEPPVLLRNDSASGAWLTVVCRVPAGGGPLVGTRVTVEAGGRMYAGEISSSGSFMSVHDPRLNFGLGAAEIVDRVEAVWPDGSRTEAFDLPVNRFLTISKSD
jgi:hypothetical protein